MKVRVILVKRVERMIISKKSVIMLRPVRAILKRGFARKIILVIERCFFLRPKVCELEFTIGRHLNINAS